MAPVWHAGAGLLVLATVGALGARPSPARGALRAHAPVLAGMAALVGWLVLSLAWARRPEIAGELVLAWMTSALMFAVVLATMRTEHAIRLLLLAFVASVALSALVGFAVRGTQTTALGLAGVVEEEGRLAGGLGDPNYLAASLVPALALTVGLAAGVRGAAARAAGAGVVLLLLAALVATESRGGFVALVATMAAALLLAHRRRRRLLALAGVLACVGSVVLAVSPTALERLTITDDSGNGRVGLSTAAWRIVEDHPALGVGLANFPVHSPFYVREPGSLEFVDLIAERGLPVHNTYLQLLAEAGPLGLLLFLAMVVACLCAAWRASRSFNRQGEPRLALLAHAVLVAAIGALTASVFLSNGSDVQLWLLLATGPALDGLARHRAPA